MVSDSSHSSSHLGSGAGPATEGVFLEARQVRVDYGEIVAVRDLSLQLKRGEIYGLVGPNGAGKTSLIRVLSTLMEPTYGEVFINGIDAFARPRDVRDAIGYVPDMAPVSADLRVEEFLELYAGAYGLPVRTRKPRIDVLLDQVGLSEARRRFCGKLSRGMTQRLVLAKTMLHQPRLLLLDEPASGLDPLARRDLRIMLERLRDEGVAVLISSHILSDLQAWCDRIGIMSKGVMVREGTVDEVVHDATVEGQCVVEARCLDADEAGRLRAFLLQREIATEDANGGREVVTFRIPKDDAAQADLLRDVVQAGVRVLTWQTQREGALEQVLFELEKEESSS